MKYIVAVELSDKNASLYIVVTEDGSISDEIGILANALLPMVVRLLVVGIVTVDSLEHPLNALSPIVVRELGRATDRRFVHVPFAPNWFVIDVMVLFDISKEPDRLVQPAKAVDPNIVRDIGENVSKPVPEQL